MTPAGSGLSIEAPRRIRGDSSTHPSSRVEPCRAQPAVHNPFDKDRPDGYLVLAVRLHRSPDLSRRVSSAMIFRRFTLLSTLLLLPAANPLPAAENLPTARGLGETELANLAAAAAVQGWINLLRDPSLADWQRVALPPNAPLDARNPWRLDPDTGILHCGGTGVHEMLLHRVPRTDGIFHVEWRFAGQPDKPSAGILARTQADNSAWHVTKLAPANLGQLLGVSPNSRGRAQRFTNGSRRPELARKAGEWNTTELVCIGSRIRLHFNGVVTADWNECKVASGLIGLEADGAPIEFRALRFKPLR